MTQKKEEFKEMSKTPLSDSFIAKGGLRRATAGILSGRIKGLMAAAVIGVASLAPMNAEAHDKRMHQAWDVLSIVNGGLNGVASLSNMTAAFLRQSGVKERLKEEIGDYYLQVQAVDAEFTGQVGSSVRSGNPNGFANYLETFLAYKKVEGSLNEQQKQELAQMSVFLGRSGQACAWMMYACELHNEYLQHKNDGKNANARAAKDRSDRCLAMAKRLDPKMSREFLLGPSVKRDGSEEYPRDTVFNRLVEIRQTTDKQWLGVYQQKVNALRGEYNGRVNKIAGELGYNQSVISREASNLLFSGLQITISGIDLHHVNTSPYFKNHGRGY